MELLEGRGAKKATRAGSLTGGEVLPNSSEPAEWELEGVKGGMLMNWG